MTLTYTVRPISDRTQFAGVAHRTPFRAPWSATLDLLDRELYYLGASRVVFELDVREDQLRIDGQLRATATAASTAVRIAFDSMHGPLIYATDRYGYDGWERPKARGWQDNIRAIALGLEALRKVDRYGITRRGEQYTGWKALAAGSSGRMSEAEALAVLREYAPQPKHADPIDKLARWARVGAHPDRHGGDHSHSDRVIAALEALGIAS
jgi:hypothetical protein